MKIFVMFASIVLLASCATLPVPGSAADGSPVEAKGVLKRATATQGDPWKRYSEVEVSYSGVWSTLATKIQPVLTDPGFRKTSVEIYQPKTGLVRQTHTGPAGVKMVNRKGPELEVTFNGTKSSDQEVKDAAALVVDAYTIFLFGPSWLVGHARNLSLMDEQKLAGESCQLVAGRLVPGIGNSSGDDFIAWIGRDSGLMKRFQFSLNGLDSTRGADVDVVFSEHWKAADGSVWPARFIERIQRPIPIHAHDWRMTSLTLDGRKMR